MKLTTTTRLKLPTMPRRFRVELPVPVAATVVTFCLIAIAALIGKIHTAPAAAVPTPQLPIILIASPLPVVPPTAAPIQVAAVLPRFVVCYDQPVNGAVLGPIPAPDASAIVARYGTSWVMTPWNGGYCWLRAADVGLPAVADLEPTDAPQVVYVSAPAPAAEAVSTPAEPLPTMAPQQAAIYDRQVWAMQRAGR